MGLDRREDFENTRNQQDGRQMHSENFIKYIIEQYKNAKDWNKNQTGGSLRKSVYNDKVDKILGCRDLVTFNHVAEAGISGKSATEINAGSSDTTGEISISSSPSVPETPAERRRALKKGNEL